MTKPIKPEEVVEKKTTLIPDFVFEAFNELIAKKWDGHCSYIKLTDAVAYVMTKIPEGVAKEDLFKNNYFDVEYSYREAGWHVEFDRPAYNETYPAAYKFRKRGK